MTWNLRWLMTLGVAVACVLLVGAPVVAQEEGTGQEVDEDFLESDPRPEIDEFLEDEMEVLAGEGETYDPGDRRDPFVSLLALQEIQQTRGPRPPGIPRPE